MLAVAAAGPLAGQQRGSPTLLLQLFGGITTGSAVWEINRQPLTVRGTEPLPKYDSLRLVRHLEPGLVLGASGTIFNQPHFGLTAEVVLLALPTADECTMVFENAFSDLMHRNEQLCTNINEAGGAATTVAATVGGIYRIAPTAFASPYVRAGVGLSIRNNSTVEVAAQYEDFGGAVSNPFLIILDPGRSRTSATAAAGAGLMIPFTPGYQVRLEVRDQMVFLDRVVGPASIVAVAPVERYLQHNLGLIVGLDVVLEQKRGRRY
jgi:hypothetical protein